MASLSRDGVRLAYSDAGAGKPPLVFVHGWCCDRTYFAPQLEHFGRRHRVVAVDLRGHGDSDKPEQDYTIGGFADDVVWLARRLRLRDVVLVGHSMGGIAVLDAAARYPETIAAAILVDPSPVVLPPGLAALAAGLVDALHGPQYREAARRHIEEVLFTGTDDLALKETVAAAMTAAPQHVMASSMKEIFRWDGEGAASACRVPVLTIVAATALTDLSRFKELCPQLITGQTVGSGHFNQLLVPEQVNAMIDRFLDVVRLSSGTPARPARPARVTRGRVRS